MSKRMIRRWLRPREVNPGWFTSFAAIAGAGGVPITSTWPWLQVTGWVMFCIGVAGVLFFAGRLIWFKLTPVTFEKLDALYTPWANAEHKRALGETNIKKVRRRVDMWVAERHRLYSTYNLALLAFVDGGGGITSGPAHDRFMQHEIRQTFAMMGAEYWQDRLKELDPTYEFPLYPNPLRRPDFGL